MQTATHPFDGRSAQNVRVCLSQHGTKTRPHYPIPVSATDLVLLHPLFGCLVPSQAKLDISESAVDWRAKSLNCKWIVEAALQAWNSPHTNGGVPKQLCIQTWLMIYEHSMTFWPSACVPSSLQWCIVQRFTNKWSELFICSAICHSAVYVCVQGWKKLSSEYFWIELQKMAWNENKNDVLANSWPQEVQKTFAMTRGTSLGC